MSSTRFAIQDVLSLGSAISSIVPITDSLRARHLKCLKRLMKMGVKLW